MEAGKKITRRKFLTLTGALGASVLVCGGLGFYATRSPEVTFPEESCEGDMEKKEKMLVAYCSKAGSTGGVAQAIGEVLCERGASVDVKLAKEVVDVSSYDAIVLGSAIYMSNLMSNAVKFLEKFQADLKDKPTAYFVVCLTMKEDSDVNRETVSSWLQPARDLVQPVGEGLFAGVLDFNKLSPLYRLIMKGMKETEGDYRDWGAIRAWTSEIQPALIRHD